MTLTLALVSMRDRRQKKSLLQIAGDLLVGQDRLSPLATGLTVFQLLAGWLAFLDIIAEFAVVPAELIICGRSV